jgi:hypothetical protein
MKEKIVVILTVITKALRKCTGWGDDLSGAMRIVKHRKNPPQFS